MRIGIEVQRIFRRKKHGMEVVGIELIREIQRLDKKNEYILFARKDDDRDCIQPTPNFQIQTRRSLSYADWEQVVLANAVRKAHLDLLHCTCNTGPIICPAPLILTLHDIIYLENLNFKGTSYQNFGNLYRRFVVPRVVSKSDLIITVSGFEKNVIVERLNVPEEKVCVIYNGVHKRFNNNHSAEELEAFRKKYRLPEQFLLFLGNAAFKKNTDNTLRAYAAYCKLTRDAIPLVIVDFPIHLVADILKSSNALDCMKHILFPGYISQNEMPLMYNAATIFLYPSIRESFGLPILEAMGCGTPVITSNTSSMPEVSGDAAMMVDPFSHEEIAAAIMKLLTDTKLRDQLIEKGMRRVTMFSWERSAKQLLEVYQEFS
jgi:glycosyltransferase involved in cell wall biosynthesis